MQQVKQNVGETFSKPNMAWLPYTIFGLAVLVTLFAIFTLSTWAETAGWHHAAQHVMIFTSGACAGGSILSLFKTKKER